MDLWEKFGMSEGIAELWQELDGILNISISSLMGAFVGHPIYVYHKAVSLEKMCFIK